MTSRVADLLAEVRQRGADLELSPAGRIVLVEPDGTPPIPDPLVRELLAHRREVADLIAAATAPLELVDVTEPGEPAPVAQVDDEADARARRRGTDLDSRRERAAVVDAALAAERQPDSLAAHLRRRW